MTLTELLGVAGFILAAVLGYVEWHRFRAKPNLQLTTDWTMGGGDFAHLKISVGNRGEARGGIRDIIFRVGPSADRANTFHWVELSDQLPLMLDPKDYWHYTLKLDPNGTQGFTRRMLDRVFTHVILVDQDGREHPFEIIPQPTDTENRVSTYGQARRR